MDDLSTISSEEGLNDPEVQQEAKSEPSLSKKDNASDLELQTEDEANCAEEEEEDVQPEPPLPPEVQQAAQQPQPPPVVPPVPQQNAQGALGVPPAEPRGRQARPIPWSITGRMKAHKNDAAHDFRVTFGRPPKHNMPWTEAMENFQNDTIRQIRTNYGHLLPQWKVTKCCEDLDMLFQRTHYTAKDRQRDAEYEQRHHQ